MSITIKIPNNCLDERQYIVRLLMNDYLGLECHIVPWENSKYSISLGADVQVFLSDSFFSKAEGSWLKEESLPQRLLKLWSPLEEFPEVELVEAEIPILYGGDPTHDEFLCIAEQTITLDLDIFGSAFFMLTRYEEGVKCDRDLHGRFPAKASLAFQEGFLERPIVNEYTEILWACLKRLSPSLKRKKHHFKMMPTHDVDHIFRYLFKSPLAIGKDLLEEAFKRNKLKSVFRGVFDAVKVKSGALNHDPFNTFNWLMEQSEKSGNISTFYFMSGGSGKAFDCDYDLGVPQIRTILKSINARGHLIGLHPSYETFKNSAILQREFLRLQSICNEEGICQKKWGSRQHYLRWDNENTAQIIESVGLDHDSTLGFADRAGFRCGTCYPFPLYDLFLRKPLNVTEHPLIVMDCSLIDNRYMNLGLGDQALAYVKKLKNRCKAYGGEFVFLWHNCRFVNEGEKAFYESVMEC